MCAALVAENDEMGHCAAALLTDRSVVRVTGGDARKFLQGLLTSDVDGAREGAAIHAGLLSPQGKILFDFFVVRSGDALLLDAPRASAAALAQRLGFYKLRADVTIAEEPHRTVAAVWNGRPDVAAGVVSYPDPRLADLGYRVVLPAHTALSALGCNEVGEADYHAMRIALGVPEGGRDFTYGDAFPHEAMFDQLHGVDFTKGCYVGQEVVSRMEHRGTARKRIVPVSADAALPGTGTEVQAGALTIGTLGSVNGTSGLALLRLDRAAEALAQGTPITADGVPIKIHRPSFARFDMSIQDAS